MPEIHLRWAISTYGSCGPFNKSKKSIQKFKETGDPQYNYVNEFGNVCFQDDMAYGDFKDLPG